MNRSNSRRSAAGYEHVLPQYNNGSARENVYNRGAEVPEYNIGGSREYGKTRDDDIPQYCNNGLRESANTRDNGNTQYRYINNDSRESGNTGDRRILEKYGGITCTNAGSEDYLDSGTASQRNGSQSFRHVTSANVGSYNRDLDNVYSTASQANPVARNRASLGSTSFRVARQSLPTFSGPPRNYSFNQLGSEMQNGGVGMGGSDGMGNRASSWTGQTNGNPKDDRIPQYNNGSRKNENTGDERSSRGCRQSSAQGVSYRDSDEVLSPSTARNERLRQQNNGSAVYFAGDFTNGNAVDHRASSGAYLSPDTCFISPVQRLDSSIEFFSEGASRQGGAFIQGGASASPQSHGRSFNDSVSSLSPVPLPDTSPPYGSPLQLSDRSTGSPNYPIGQANNDVGGGLYKRSSSYVSNGRTILESEGYFSSSSTGIRTPSSNACDSFNRQSIGGGNIQRQPPRDGPVSSEQTIANNSCGVNYAENRLSVEVRTKTTVNNNAQIEECPIPDQSNMLRRISQEFYSGAGGVVNQRSRMLDRNRLSAIDENSRLKVVSSRSLATCSSGSSTDVIDGVNSQHVAMEEDGRVSPVPDGTNFIRHHKVQVSLRKAYGILEEFDMMEQQLRQPGKPPSGSAVSSHGSRRMVDRSVSTRQPPPARGRPAAIAQSSPRKAVSLPRGIQNPYDQFSDESHVSTSSISLVSTARSSRSSAGSRSHGSLSGPTTAADASSASSIINSSVLSLYNVSLNPALLCRYYYCSRVLLFSSTYSSSIYLV